MPVTGFQTNNAYTDVASLQSLKGKSRTGDDGAIKEVAQQFEAVFLQMMLSSMRKTVPVNEEFSNEKSMYYDLFDKQVAMDMSSKGGIGLAKMMMTQLSKNPQAIESLQQAALNIPAAPVHNSAPVVPAVQAEVQQPVQIKSAQRLQQQDTTPVKAEKEQVVNSKKEDFKFDSPLEFLRQIWHSASDVIAESGLDPRAIIAQAALETGWGKHIIKNTDGNSSHNLFGIKSNNGWSGAKVLANTLEYKDGVMAKSNESFRSYDSFMDSVRDYIGFITNNERYKNAVARQDDPVAYANELQRAGYATDPDYADKITNIINGKEFRQFFDVSGIKAGG